MVKHVNLYKGFFLINSFIFVAYRDAIVIKAFDGLHIVQY